MKVTLIHFTGKDAPNEQWAAADLLLFTKQTRLTLSPGLMDEIRAWPVDKKLAELNYMANTIRSSWEFIDYVFLVEMVSRAYTHQQVRTRVASYAQQTMRVLPMEKYDYVFTEANLANPKAVEIIDEVNDVIRRAYAMLLDIGQAPEDARGILPTNIATNIVCKFDMRAFADLAGSRMGGRTQREYQRVVQGMVDQVLAVHPWAETFIFNKPRNYFDDIEAFADREFGGNLLKKGELLKIVDKMRKERS